MEANKLINFVKKFFENLKAKVSWNSNVLLIENVSESFEKSYGKKSPYRLVFREEDRQEDTELISPGKGMLNHITRYLESSGGNTTILKMNFNINPLKIIENKLKINHQNITSLKQTFKNNFFYRFTFQTNFTYLNKKEQSLNEIYVHNREIVEGNLEGYPVLEGRKEDISTKDIEKNYEVAKIKIKLLIQEKTTEIRTNLNKKLEKETNRVYEHYKNQRDEITKKLLDEAEKLNVLNNQKTSSETDKKELRKKIQRIENLIEKIKEDRDSCNINQEEKLTINDLRQKHSLNIENKLINTTVIYYPLYTFSLIFEKDLKKHLDLAYNPLTESFDLIRCSNCKNPIKVIDMCSEGHITCSNCLSHCEDCKKFYCKNCLKNYCFYCKKELCKKCVSKCSLCLKYFCKEHIHKDSITEQIGCINCFKRCPICKKYSNPKFFKKVNKLGICQKCYNKEVTEKITEKIYNSR